MDPYLSGQVLYGDDFDAAQIEAWFKDEADAYFAMSGESQTEGGYGYAELNRQTLFRHLPAGRSFHHALGFGAGEATELAPLAPRIARLTVLESTSAYGLDPRLTMSVKRLLAHPSGDIDLPSGSVDLVTCLDVLHHIPNVSHVLREFARILEPGGMLLLREPITSMGGNWGTQRPGLTPHERGIPLERLRAMLAESGFRVRAETPVIFPPFLRLWKLGLPPYGSRVVTALDVRVCRLLRSRIRYHASTRWEKVRPAEVCTVAVR